MIDGLENWKQPRYSKEDAAKLEKDIRNRQVALSAFVDPDAGIDRPVQCHNLDRAPLQRLSHPCQSSHDYYRSGNPAGTSRVIYTLEDGRFLVAAPDVHGIERYYVADEKTYLVLVEDVTWQFHAEERDWETGALPDPDTRVNPARVLP